VLFWELHAELVDNLAGVAEHSAEKAAVSVHNDESKLLVIFKQLRQRFDVEFVVAQVKRCVDGPERLEIYCDLALFAIICHDGAAVKHKAIRRYLRVVRN
jgi:hypothetical protein